MGGAAAAVFSFENGEEGFDILGRGMGLLVVEVGPEFDIIAFALEAPEAGFLDDAEFSFDAVLIADGPFVAASHDGYVVL